MTTRELYRSIQMVQKPNDDSYNVFEFEGNVYYGVTKDGNIVFLMNSLNPKMKSSMQLTKYLFLGINVECTIKLNEQKKIEKYDIIICYETNPEKILSFLHLVNVYSMSAKKSEITIKTFFESIKNLFSNKEQLPSIELQGLYGELYFMNFIQNEKVNIIKYWQSAKKMKFDFSITDYKKIEVKSTIGSLRKHKFKHEQLISDIYDTWIVSIMLRKDDRGLSLYKLVEEVKERNPQDILFHIKLANLLNNYSTEELDSIKYNDSYTKDNIAFYKTSNIPRFLTKQPDGVSNTEYDSDLSNITSEKKEFLIDWIQNVLNN